MTLAQTIKFSALGLGGLFVAGFGLGTVEMLPDDTPVTVSPALGYYATLDCLRVGRVEGGGAAYPLARLGRDHELADEYIWPLGKVGPHPDYRPDPVCRDASGFEKRRGTVSGDILRDLFG